MKGQEKIIRDRVFNEWLIWCLFGKQSFCVSLSCVVCAGKGSARNTNSTVQSADSLSLSLHEIMLFEFQL